MGRQDLGPSSVQALGAQTHAKTRYCNHCHTQGHIEKDCRRKAAGEPRMASRAPRSADSLAQDGVLPGNSVAECAQDREVGSLLRDCGMLGTEADSSLTAAENVAMDWLEEADEEEEEQEISAPEPPQGLVPKPPTLSDELRFRR